MKPSLLAAAPVWLWISLTGPACQGSSQPALIANGDARTWATPWALAGQTGQVTQTPNPLFGAVQKATGAATSAAPAAAQHPVASALDSLTLPDDDDDGAVVDANRSTGPVAAPPSTLPPEPAHPANAAPGAPLEPNLLHDAAAQKHAANPDLLALAPAEAAGMQMWVDAIAAPRPNETFGEFVARVALLQVGKPYGNPPSGRGAETLRLSFRRFQCVSFVESVLSMARCMWRRDSSLVCFARELAQLRYRGGRIDGYASRLHYYEDWLTDNANKGLLEMMTQRMGGVATPHQARYMTHHPDLYGPMSDPKIFAAIASMEAQVSNMHPAVIAREQVGAVLPMLETGDVIAVTSNRPDILVSHTGFALRRGDGTLHMVHASSAKHHVVETEYSLADYIEDKRSRAGIMVARPVAPH